LISAQYKFYFKSNVSATNSAIHEDLNQARIRIPNLWTLRGKLKSYVHISGSDSIDKHK